MSKQQISIIGAGFGGLTLGQCLLKRGIQTVLYQKGPQTPGYGYGITLHAQVYRPLLKVLDMDESTFRKRVAVDAGVGGVGMIDPNKLVQPSLVGPDSFRAHRGKLENLLREGLDVRWKHALNKVEKTTGGGNTIVLENGARVENSRVIVADGVHSHTRKSLLPDVSLKILPIVAFNGKRRVKRSIFDKLYAPALEKSTVLEIAKSGAVLQTSVNEIQEDIVSISWVYSRPARGSEDPLFQPNRPLAGATDTPEEFFQEIASIPGLDSPFSDIFDVQTLRSERILSWLMRTVQPSLDDVKDLVKSKVFLMGDAMHAQPILGGEGANAAMVDALQMADMIAADDKQGLDEWYTARYSTWTAGVEKSEKNIETMHAGNRASL